MSCTATPAPGEPAGVACAHRAWLGAVASEPCGCTSPARTRGPWQLAAAPQREALLDLVVTDLERGVSLAGALLRVADRFGPGEEPVTVVAAGQGQLAALGWRTPLRYAARGGGTYLLDAVTHPAPDPAPNDWLEAPPGSVLLLDPCGPTVTLVQEPELR